MAMTRLGAGTFLPKQAIPMASVRRSSRRQTAPTWICWP